jgi:hypothetical protein
MKHRVFLAGNEILSQDIEEEGHSVFNGLTFLSGSEAFQKTGENIPISFC